ncbi:MAG: FG-GAP-like repeat-containing protein, partial [Bacteroidota bacterium]|nr:FG-GAP-like repeat-containing protein [Bacteroidota bacterium]
VRNNNFANENGGYAVLVQTPGVLTSMDHNNLYTAGNYIAAWNNVKIFDLFDLQTASGLNSASLSVYPHFIADNDPHTVAPWLDNTGTAIPGIDVDFDGELRHAVTPDIGADEFTADPSTTTALSGTYTIGSGGNYPTISSAFEDALLKGVSTGITFHLLNGTYNEQVAIRSIPGAGIDKRITLASQTGNPEDAIISYSSDDYYANWVMQLHGADFITIQNLTVKAEGSSYARVIDLWQGADSVEIRGNVLEGIIQSGNNANYAVIYSGDSDYRNRRIEENILRRGTFGVFMRRDQNNYQYATGAEILNNTITENGYTGIHLQFYNAPFITGNDIEAPASGIKALSCSNDLVINKNIIKVDYDMGIQLSTCYGTNDKKGLVSNNFIHIGGNSGVQGIYINSSSNQLVLNNSVHLTNTNATSKAFYISSGGTSSVTILNNIFANTGGGYSYYVTAPATVVGSDYNDLYSSGDILAYWGANAENLEALRVASSMEEHSISIHPQFNSDTDLHTMAEALDSAGVSLAAVPNDIDGDPRHLLFPDIGADEFSFILNNRPVAANDSITTAIEIIIYPLLNDFDIDSDSLTIIEISSPNQGTASIMAGDTTILYTPVYFSPPFDSFQYIIHDDHGGVDTAYIFITLYQPMTEFTRMEFEIQNVSHGSGRFGDYDNDGDLDILLTGWIGTNQDYITKIYEFNNDSYSDIEAGLRGLSSGTPEGAAWCDYDNDGDLDIIISGSEANNVDNQFTTLYSNFLGTFTDETSDVNISGLVSGSVDWGDYDNDGRIDLAVSGTNENGSLVSQIYKNYGPDTYGGTWVLTNSQIELTETKNGEATWVDFDSDGDLDIFICGVGLDTALLYRNDNGIFTPVTTGIKGVRYTAVDWGDYDNDGDPDLVICGNSGQGYLSRIYRNDGKQDDSSWNFTDINAGLTNVESGDAAWGDYDNDGDLDLIICGNTQMLQSITILYKNDAGDFANSGLNFPSYGRSSLEWGDYDNDGDLDLLMTGYSPSEMGQRTLIYRNDIDQINMPPSAPTNLGFAIEEDHILLSWTGSTDEETPSDGLSYNIRIGTSSGVDDVMTSMAHGSGTRKLSAIGNARQSSSYAIYGLSAGTYYWSIQAIDHGFRGSNFASDQTIVLTGINDKQINSDAYKMGQIYPNPATDHITLQLYSNMPADDYILKINSMTGKVMLNEVIHVYDVSQELSVGIDNLPGGIYIISLSGNKTIYKARFIKLE